MLIGIKYRPERTTPYQRKFRYFFQHLLSVIVIASLISGCTLISNPLDKVLPNQTWTDSLLRRIDPVDSSNPSADILAIFSVWQTDKFLVRLDFADTPDESTLINLDFFQSNLSSCDPQKCLSLEFQFSLDSTPRITSNYLKHDIEISIIEVGMGWVSLSIMGISREDLRLLSVKTIQNGIFMDEIVGINLSEVAAPAPLFLAFWNTLPASTPAQVLRRWDGAHTGPVGSRHGLRYLIEGIEEFHLPVTLLDLKQAQSINALLMVNALDQVKALVDDKWLFLPDVASGNIVSQSFTLSTSRMTGLQNDLPLSPAIYGALTSTFPGYEVYFYSTPKSLANIYGTVAYRLVPIPGVSQIDLLDQKGLTLSAISNLAETGNSADTSDLVILGGDFSESYWGDPVAIKYAFSYIAEHPWINVLSLPDLLISPSRSLKEYVPVCVDLLCTPENPALKDNEFTLWQNNAYAQISKLPYSSLSTATWSTFTMLTAPSKDEKLQSLRWEYHSTVDYLLLADHWTSDPGRIQDCFELSDQPVCVLANDTIFALLSPNGARLVMLFTIYNGEITQWVAPYSQYIVGRSDSSLWKIGSSLTADPALVEGAFVADGEPLLPYQTEISENTIIFHDAENANTRTYKLLADRLQVIVESNSPSAYLIPVFGSIISAEDKFSILANSKLLPSATTDKSISVNISGADVQTITYTDSMTEMKLPENPSFSYPKGHYLPIPFSLFELNADGNLFVEWIPDN